ncbi:MAG: hypothetical protein K9J12_18210 [Melioribacteraceae bacterium]|nr:hypothetical protein [Melioribacteraceae bacterium]
MRHVASQFFENVHVAHMPLPWSSDFFLADWIYKYVVPTELVSVFGRGIN